MVPNLLHSFRLIGVGFVSLDRWPRAASTLKERRCCSLSGLQSQHEVVHTRHSLTPTSLRLLQATGAPRCSWRSRASCLPQRHPVSSLKLILSHCRSNLSYLLRKLIRNPRRACRKGSLRRNGCSPNEWLATLLFANVEGSMRSLSEAIGQRVSQSRRKSPIWVRSGLEDTKFIPLHSNTDS